MDVDRLSGRGDIELIEFAADGARRVDPPEHQVGVRHRRLGVAEAVAGGAGIRPRRVGPDLQKTTVVHRGDRAAAGADGCDLDHRRAHHHAEIDRCLRRQGCLSAGHERHVEGCPAHVAGDDVVEAGGAGDFRCRDDAGSWARQRRAHREALGRVHRHHAAI